MQVQAQEVADRSHTLLLTVAESAEELRISRANLYKLMRSGAVPSIHIGQRRLIRRSDLAAFIASL